MNFKRPLELKSEDGKGTGKWHYTNHNDNQKRTYPIGYCHEDEGHDSPEEACACYKRFLLDHELTLDAGEYEGWVPCQIADCQVRTGNFARVGYQTYVLCPEHMNRESLEHLVHVGESFGSY